MLREGIWLIHAFKQTNENVKKKVIDWWNKDGNRLCLQIYNNLWTFTEVGKNTHGGNFSVWKIKKNAK